jgi:hypothetical protein
MPISKDYEQKRRNQVKVRQCACSRPAFKFKNNDFVCARCDQIEEVRSREAMARANRVKWEDQRTAKPQGEFKETPYRASLTASFLDGFTAGPLGFRKTATV